MTEIAVLSGKGGTGKSGISAALASLASKVVVADCDVDAANLHLILEPENYLEEVYTSGQKAQIDADKCTSCGKCIDYCRFDAIKISDGEFTVVGTACDGCQLCARVCPTGAITMIDQNESRWFAGDIRNGKMVHARLAPGEDNSGKLVNLVRDHARKEAHDIQSDLILIDGPPGIGCPVISTLSGINKVLLVTEPTVSGIHDLKRITELVNQYKLEVFLVINKCDINMEMTEEIEKWAAGKQIPVISKIPFSEVWVEAMINCKSIVDWAPESALSNEIRVIWNQLIGNE
ncbi:ATP-binding protein [Mangrovibacterium marinum]|uniref:MinD superfamily P-loop ATPase n=1 Tax=Mangrovibacterium marinum TaxID=1639118 RepID=A0A2T5C372_9BACT|nr:ATP-binding protein [Mangrovibacterium marinum]PTN09212.1 MinD superfamily P-loop ATPase [Mangrovibacterium marinum]